MSVVSTTLRCGFCGHEWEGIYVASSMQTDTVFTCPRCKSLRGKPKCFSEPADTDNYFGVGLDRTDESVTFCIPGLHAEKVFRLRGALPREMALNFAAWLVRVADPDGEDFQRLHEEIRKR